MAGAALAMGLGGCSKPAPTLPDDPIDKAASCTAVTAANERAKIGVKGDLPVEAQARVLQYGLLAATEGERYDPARATLVSQRSKALFDDVTTGKWKSLKALCDTAYPSTRPAKPDLPEQPLDRVLQCRALVGYVRKAIGGENGRNSEAVSEYGRLADRLASKAAPLTARAGLKGDALKARNDAALGAAARLGQPAAIIAACEAEYEH